MKKLIDFILNEDGATAVEYAIMASAIAAVIVAVVMAVGDKTTNNFNSLNNKF